MTIKTLLASLRHNIALHATLEIKQVTAINANTQDLVQFGQPACERLKLHGTTIDGIAIYIEVELIGTPEMLEKFRFQQGKHAGLVLRVID